MLLNALSKVSVSGVTDRKQARWICCETEQPYRYAAVEFSSEGILYISRAARAQLALTNDELASGTDLSAFPAVKSVGLGALNPWDVSGLRAQAKYYLTIERAKRLLHGDG